MLLAQYGHAATEKISNGLGANILDGVIFCPTTHTPEKLKEIIEEYASFGKDKLYLLDTNFYATALSADKLGKFDNTYPFFMGDLKRTDFTTKNISKLTNETLEFQNSINLNYILSPSVLIPGFTSFESQIALQIYQETIDQAKDKKITTPILLSLTINESALREEEQLNEFLDAITTYDVKGFYVIVETTNKNWEDPSTLANYMYLVRVLTENGFEVFCGYTDLIGFLLKAVGSVGIATGWWKNLRYFTRERFFKKSGGRAPRKMYTSIPLLNTIYIESELQPIGENGAIEEVLSKTAYDKNFKDNPVNQPWSPEISILHHWEAIKNMLNTIQQKDTEEERLNLMISKIENAQSLYTKLKSLDIKFEYDSGPNHLRVWRDAIALYKQL